MLVPRNHLSKPSCLASLRWYIHCPDAARARCWSLPESPSVSGARVAICASSECVGLATSVFHPEARVFTLPKLVSLDLRSCTLLKETCELLVRALREADVRMQGHHVELVEAGCKMKTAYST